MTPWCRSVRGDRVGRDFLLFRPKCPGGIVMWMVVGDSPGDLTYAWIAYAFFAACRAFKLKRHPDVVSRLFDVARSCLAASGRPPSAGGRARTCLARRWLRARKVRS